MSAVKAEIEQNDAIKLGVPGLGERLRSARVARDLDLAKMSERIHLTVDMVDALEHDDYSEMPARVFVRGYIRNYARTVELPIDSVMAQFDALWPDEVAPVRVTQSPRLPSDGQSDKGWHRAMTWLLVLVMLVLFLIWWQGYLDKFIATWDARMPSLVSEKTSEDATFEPALGTGMLPLAIPFSDEAGGSILSPSDAASAAPQVAEIRPGAEDAVASAGGGIGGEMDSRAAMPAVTQSDVQADASGISSELQGAEAVVEAEAAPAAIVQAVPEPAPEPEGVRVLFSQDCWVDIRDSTRTFKLFGTMKRGTERTLGGKPPYRFVLGNAKGVEILVDGKPFDLASETVANVARFTLSP